MIRFQGWGAIACFSFLLLLTLAAIPLADMALRASEARHIDDMPTWAETPECERHVEPSLFPES